MSVGGAAHVFSDEETFTSAPSSRTGDNFINYLIITRMHPGVNEGVILLVMYDFLYLQIYPIRSLI